MKLLIASIVILALAPLAVSAQTRNQAAAAGAAGIATRLKSQGYGNIQDLRPLPDGKWTGVATRNGVRVTVTSDPAGTTIAR